MDDIRIIRYNSDLKKIWNDFVESSKNGTFLFNRDYMDYHSDRFEDESFLIYRKEKLYCLLPACIIGDTLYSHAGLTYGGLVMSSKCSAAGILEVFNSLCELLKKQGIRNLVYKPTPYIYHTLPSEEDLYALFRHNAFLKVRNISSTIPGDHKLNFIKDRRAALRRAENFGLTVVRTSDYKSFWQILENNLNHKYGVNPVHSCQEIERLSNLFPENIRLYGACKDARMYGGVLCYLCKETVHTQYISASEDGKKYGAIDLIINFLLNQEFPQFKYFDFGISNEDGGRYLNENLIYQKEGFGGRGVCYDTWNISLT